MFLLSVQCANHHARRALISFILFLGAMRTNVPLALVVFCLIFVFSFIAAANFMTPFATTAADGAYILKLLKIGGGFGLVTALSGW